MLRHFTPGEFREWWWDMDPQLLSLLDEQREQWGAPIRISKDDGALGRHLGPMSESRHNIDRWGKVQAADIILAGMVTRSDVRRAVDIARDLGFGGIGLYPHWQQGAGLHVDVRPREGGHIATWGRIRQVKGYVSYARALEEMPP